MDIYQFFHGALAWTVTLAVMLPLSVPMAALAFRVWRGTTEVEDIEGSDLWTRSFLAAAGVAVVGVGFVLLDYLLAGAAEIAPGPVHLVVFMGYMSVAIWILFYVFSLEDFFQGMSLAIIFFALPFVVLWPLNYFLGLWNWALNYVLTWLPAPVS